MLRLVLVLKLGKWLSGTLVGWVIIWPIYELHLTFSLPEEMLSSTGSFWKEWILFFYKKTFSLLLRLKWLSEGFSLYIYMLHLPGGSRDQMSYTSPQILMGKICQMYQIIASKRSALGLRIPKPGCCLTVAHSVIITGLCCFQRLASWRTEFFSTLNEIFKALIFLSFIQLKPSKLQLPLLVMLTWFSLGNKDEHKQKKSS